MTCMSNDLKEAKRSSRYMVKDIPGRVEAGTFWSVGAIAEAGEE